MAVLHARHKAYGDLRVLDVTTVANLSKLRPTFERLRVDPYVPEGFRRKHIGWFDVARGQAGSGQAGRPEFEPIRGLNTLYQSREVNPVHGGLARVYPPIQHADGETLRRLLALFTEVAEVPDGARLLLQLQRVTTTPDNVGKPSVEDWHRDGVRAIGIVVVNRDNITGGINEFRSPDQDVDLRKELPPGFMAVFNDAGVLHRVTDIKSLDGATMGFRDVILISH